MPIFEYKCNDCNYQFEELVGSSSQAVPCPKCKSTNCSKLISVFAASSSGSKSSATPCGQPSCGSGFS